MPASLSETAEKIVGKFRKIMGPVANTLGKEAAEESGGSVEGERIVLRNEAQFRKFKEVFKKKCGKIMGYGLAEAMMKEAGSSG